MQTNTDTHVQTQTNKHSQSHTIPVQHISFFLLLSSQLVYGYKLHYLKTNLQSLSITRTYHINNGCYGYTYCFYFFFLLINGGYSYCTEFTSIMCVSCQKTLLIIVYHACTQLVIIYKCYCIYFSSLYRFVSQFGFFSCNWFISTFNNCFVKYKGYIFTDF